MRGGARVLGARQAAAVQLRAGPQRHRRMCLLEAEVPPHSACPHACPACPPACPPACLPACLSTCPGEDDFFDAQEELQPEGSPRQAGAAAAPAAQAPAPLHQLLRTQADEVQWTNRYDEEGGDGADSLPDTQASSRRAAGSRSLAPALGACGSLVPNALVGCGIGLLGRCMRRVHAVTPAAVLPLVTRLVPLFCRLCKAGAARRVARWCLIPRRSSRWCRHRWCRHTAECRLACRVPVCCGG